MGIDLVEWMVRGGRAISRSSIPRRPRPAAIRCRCGSMPKIPRSIIAPLRAR
jgi:hypothetical protein